MDSVGGFSHNAFALVIVQELEQRYWPFPGLNLSREVLAGQNLTFASYQMPQRRNNARAYDVKIKGPGAKKQGVLKLGKLDPPRKPQISRAGRPWLPVGFSLALFGALYWLRRRAAK